jgi:hypothetical protein
MSAGILCLVATGLVLGLGRPAAPQRILRTPEPVPA